MQGGGFLTRDAAAVQEGHTKQGGACLLEGCELAIARDSEGVDAHARQCVSTGGGAKAGWRLFACRIECRAEERRGQGQGPESVRSGQNLNELSSDVQLMCC